MQIAPWAKIFSSDLCVLSFDKLIYKPVLMAYSKVASVGMSKSYCNNTFFLQKDTACCMLKFIVILPHFNKLCLPLSFPRVLLSITSQKFLFYSSYILNRNSLKLCMLVYIAMTFCIRLFLKELLLFGLEYFIKRFVCTTPTF